MMMNPPQTASTRFRRALAGLALFGATLAIAGGALAASFTQIDPSAIPTLGDRYAAPEAEATFRLDRADLASDLANAPIARTNDSRPTLVVELPLPDGRLESFRVLESPIMAAPLQARYPEIRTYEAYGIDDRSAFARFSLTPHGFHAVIFRDSGSVWIDPYQTADTQHYSVCFGRDYRRSDRFAEGSPESFATCTPDTDPQRLADAMDRIRQADQMGGLTTGDELRTYRTAVAATGEYTTYHGGTVPLGQAAIVVAMNRVNGIFQKECSLIMELVANNDLVVYTNGATDPYTNNNGSTMLNQNQATLNAVIGTANYDMGHVFSTGGGGIAQLGCVCTGNKAKGVTGLPQPIGDSFYVDFVAHEMGHQWGAAHTFNGVVGNCAGGNRNGPTAYEPGSGTTVMAYAGICGSDNIQLHSDDYMHVASFIQIRQFTEAGTGDICAATTATGNTPPSAEASQGAAYWIPTGTPFELTGSGNDDDLDPLTYCWEEFDLGPAGSPNTPSGNAPIFRSFDPVTTPTRIFPKIADIVNNVQIKGEILPSYARTLKFKLTVRDNLGGVAYDDIENITVVAASFQVTAPNVPAIVWAGGATETVTWNPSTTAALPIDCQTVDLYLSTDGGFTYPTLLAAGEANDGSADVVAPNAATTTARVKVKAADNVFFDISNVNFSITENSVDVTETTPALATILRGADPNPFGQITHIRFALDRETPVSLKVYSASGREITTLANDVLSAGEHTRSWNGRDYDDRPTAAGVYFYRLEAGDRVETQRVVRID